MARKLNPQRRAKLLETALRLFVTNGVQNTTTALIAREAGVAAGTLFLYFPTKQDLIHALILNISQEVSEHITGLLEPALSAQESFAAIWHGSIGWFMAHPEAYQYVQQVRDSRLLSEAVVKESEQYFTYYYAAIQKGFAEGSLKPYPIELIGAFLYQGIVATMNLISRQPEPAMQQAYIWQGFRIFWDGIRVSDEEISNHT
jgi:AcrR family transcriptional regulator